MPSYELQTLILSFVAALLLAVVLLLRIRNRYLGALIEFCVDFCRKLLGEFDVARNFLRREGGQDILARASSPFPPDSTIRSLFDSFLTGLDIHPKTREEMCNGFHAVQSGDQKSRPVGKATEGSRRAHRRPRGPERVSGKR